MIKRKRKWGGVRLVRSEKFFYVYYSECRAYLDDKKVLHFVKNGEEEVL